MGLAQEEGIVSKSTLAGKKHLWELDLRVVTRDLDFQMLTGGDSLPGTALPASLSLLGTENLAWQFLGWKSAHTAWKTHGLQPTETARSRKNSESFLCLSCRWCQILGEYDILSLLGECPLHPVKVAQWCLTLCNPMDYTVHGILQARILEWVAFPFSRRSSHTRDRTQVSHIAGRFFISWATREVLASTGLFNTVRNIYCLSQLKPDKVFERIF